ncbi:MAG TPA: hypothetical protein PKE32_01425 [Miltoncostaeaceae bacterium]|nr:hypothetical protein [Miltoncostaeaceae bacterium]
MTDESVSRRLAEIAPVAPELVEAFARFEDLSYTELHRRFEEHTARLREWVSDPENEGRPISEWSGYLDRIALDALIEQRTWVE